MNQIIINEYGNYFKEFKFAIDNRSDQIHSYYICTKCKKIFLSKKSMKVHQCKELSACNTNISYNLSIKYLLIWLSKKNATYRSLYDIDFNGFLHNINKKYILPSENSLRKSTIQFANKISSQIYKKLNGKAVSLLIDGVERNSHKYQGQILYTPNQLYFLGLFPCEEETKINIATIISETAIKLKNNNAKLIAVCTDNFSSNISALDGGPFSAQQLCNQNFIRFPCCCHTINLAIKDTFESKHIDIKNNVIELINYFKHLSKINNQIKNVPQFIEVRWFSIYYCVSFIIQHKIYLDQHFLNNYYDIIQNKYGWPYIYSILKLLNELITKLESDFSSVADVFPYFQTTINKLIEIKDKIPENFECNIANDLIDSLLDRFSSTVHLNVPILAFFLTGNGMKYANNKNEQYYLAANTAIETFQKYAIDSPEIDNLLQFFKYFLNFNNHSFLISQNSTDESVNFWKKILNNGKFWSNEPEFFLQHQEFKGIEKKFAKYALEILSIPCSECAVERAFSHLSDILMNNKRNLNFETLNSLLIIRMNSIFLKQNGKKSQSFIMNEMNTLSHINYDRNDPQFEDDALVYF